MSPSENASPSGWVQVDAAFLDALSPLTADELLAHHEGAEADWRHGVSDALPLLPVGEQVVQALEEHRAQALEPEAPEDDEVEEEDVDAVRLALPRHALNVLTGPTGEGKTTLLFQVAARLARGDDATVLWLPPGARLDEDATLELLPKDGSGVLILDRAHEHVTRLHHLLRRAGTTAVRVLAASREDDWAFVKGRDHGWQALGVRYHEHGALDLDETSAERLIATWSELGPAGLGRLADLPEGERVAELLEQVRETRESTGGALFGGLISARHDDDSLDEALRRAVPRVREHAGGADLLRALAAVALIDALEIDGLDPRLVAAVVDREADRLHEEILAPLAERVAVALGGRGSIGRLWLRHPRIADACVRVLAELDDGPDLAQVLVALVDAAIRLGEEHDDLLHQRELVHLSRRVPRRLAPLLGEERAAEVAVTVAEAACDRGGRVDLHAEHLLALTRAGRLREASDSVPDRFAQLRELVDHDLSIRSFVGAWGRLEHGLGRESYGLWLVLCSLSDQLLDAKGSMATPLPDRRFLHGLHDLATTFSTWSDGLLAPLSELADLTKEVDRERRGVQRSGSADTLRPPADDEVVTLLTTAATQAAPESLPAGLPQDGLSFDRFIRSYRRQVLARFGPLLNHVPEEVDSETLFSALETYCEESGRQPYDAQLEAFLGIVEGDNVVLATPTGSGKSLVGLAAHFVGFCHGQRSVYTAPIKALVNEKFFSLCRDFGSQNVGLMTGDVSLNGDAPILCCTAEILADMALAEGEDTPFGWVVMDEFHYYNDRRRGIAWLLPLLEMRRARFLLMSASLGDPEATRADVERKTGHSTQLVHSTVRPVDLEFEYQSTTLLEAVRDTLVREITPTYIVSFSKKEAGARALQLKNMPADDEAVAERLKQVRLAIKKRLGQVSFDTPFGKWLRGILAAGIGVHHGGLLPKYRRLVEQLANEGLLWLISGTDTLGVGVNLPIRTVIFTQLYKWEKDKSRKVSVREFHQIAGRAGRAGHDTLGTSIVLAPEHLVLNEREKAKAKAKSKKFHAQSEPRGFKPWDESSFRELTVASPPPMKTRFRVTAPLVMKVLTRPGGGVDDLERLIDAAGLGPEETNRLVEDARKIRQSLLENGSLTELPERDEDDRAYLATSDDSRSGRPLILFMKDALVSLPESEDRALEVLSVVEAVVETSTEKIVSQQVARVRKEIYEAWCAEGDERPPVDDMKAAQQGAQAPQPCREFLEERFEVWSLQHPWLAIDQPRPRSIIRDMYERGLGFVEYAREDDLMQEEGPLLRHCSEVYKVMSRGLPPFLEQEDDVQDLVAWLSLVVRQVDSSLLTEWERLSDPDAVVVAEPQEDPSELADITRQVRAFKVMVRNETFNWIRLVARMAYSKLPVPADADWTPADRLAPYWEEHDEVLTDADARGPKYFDFDPSTGEVAQRILDPEGHADWVLHGRVDRDASRDQGRAVLDLVRIEQVGMMDD